MQRTRRNLRPSFLGESRKITLKTATCTDEVLPLVYTPEPFKISHKELKLTQIAVDLVQRINGTPRAPISVTDVAMVATVLHSSGWLRRHFDGSGHDFANPEEEDRFFTNFYDAVSVLTHENPQYNPPLHVLVGDRDQFDAGAFREDAEV
jgi:hypothetical protein